jgi:hypothetical protein
MVKFRIQIDNVSKVEDSIVVTGIVRNTVSRKKGKPFVATQNKYGLFKVGGTLKDRGFSRGERIAIARRCKLEAASHEAAEAASETNTPVIEDLPNGTSILDIFPFSADLEINSEIEGAL